jgi:peptidoglycan hydrolase-like protein with peptidoglycan-binding domain
MTKTTIRTAALSAALMFGVATVLPLAATAQTAAAPAAPAATAMPKKHMMHHHHHHAGSAMVKSAQAALNKEGASLATDGMMGPKTHAALQSYQQAHGLKATGHLDKATRAALKI